MRSYRLREIVVAIAFAVLALPPAFASGGRETNESPGESGESAARITVGAGAEVSAAPDVARVTVGVRTADRSLERASADNDERMAAVIAALAELGIADRDMQTTAYSVYLRQPAPDRTFGDGLERGEYQVSNSLRVTIRELERTGEAISTATRAGANQVGGIRFEIEDPEPLAAEARRKAMQAARAKAEQLAASEGLRLGRVWSITESDRPAAQPVFRTAEAAVDAVPISPGELSHSVQVSVSYELLADESR